LARRDPELADALRDFLVVNDGLGVDLASWMLYKKKFPQNLVGTDFVPYLLSSPRSLRIYLLGSRMPTLERAASQMKTTWPQHEIVGWHHGYFSLEQEAEISEGIEKLAPDLVLVAMGNVRQEIWIANNVPGACRCGIGVGALLDYIAGDVPRAPAFVRKARSEWLFRMFLEPRRLARRYLVGNTLFLIHLVVSIFQRRSD
jgi:exopolysaccharide biosynthesis WecB/TagA/CpsF family protein